MPAYMLIDGAVGDVTAKGEFEDHTGWIQIKSFSFTITSADEDAQGKDPNEEKDKEADQKGMTVRVTKAADSSTPTLMTWMVVPDMVIPAVTVEAVKENGAWWYRYVLSNVRITRYSMDSEEKEMPEEEYSLKCEAIRVDTIWLVYDNETWGDKYADFTATLPDPETEFGLPA